MPVPLTSGLEMGMPLWSMASGDRFMEIAKGWQQLDEPSWSVSGQGLSAWAPALRKNK